MKDKKKILLVIGALLSVIVITVGVSFAFFNYAKLGTTENSITSGTITFLYTEVDKVGAGIKLENAIPITDTAGKMLTGSGNVFNFKVTSTTNMDASIPYEVTARMKEGSDLDPNVVKVYLTKGETEEEVLLEKYGSLTQTSRVTEDIAIEKTIYKGKVPSKTSNYEETFKLRMWVDEKTDYSPVEKDGEIVYPYNNKTFTLMVNVYADAKVVTQEDIDLEGNNEISSITVEEKKAVEVENSNYNYEVGLASGTTEVSMDVLTESTDTVVKVEKIDNLANSSNVKRLSSTKSLTVTEGDNYFKITTTSLKGDVKTNIINVRVGDYKEALLNGTDPVLSSNLVPVMLKNDGTVQKVDTTYSWYDYETKKWANAVVLRNSDTYKVGEVIPESAIESYFVWIPKYSYQLWDLGNYNSLTSIDNTKPHAIPIRFGLTNTSDSKTGECTTPTTAGASGNCKVGDYMTHPAFLAFNSNGMWVGKFETGYDGATSKAEAQTDVDKVDTSKIIIKPNTYSWRNISIGNAFKNSYNYFRNNESHMMKNTEWGAVAYLSHSIYGTCTSSTKCTDVRVNNNSEYITGYAATIQPTVGLSKISIEGNRTEGTSLGEDGTYTLNYFNNNSAVASTTQNITGIYDMSSGAWEYVMGYSNKSSIGVGGSSGLTDLYSDFFTASKWKKYYDEYSSTTNIDFYNRILGDGTGEMGPFGSQEDPDKARNKISWYGDFAHFIIKSNPWFIRSGIWYHGSNSGMFTFSSFTAAAGETTTYRIVLNP